MMAADLSAKFSMHPLSCNATIDERTFSANNESGGMSTGADEQTLPDLPQGWERAVTSCGTPYYIDHNKQETTFVHPVTKECLLQTETIQTPPTQLVRPDDFPRSLRSPSPTLSPTMDGRRASKKKSTNNNLRSPAVKRSSQSLVAMQGWLYKQGSDGLMLWKKRWFVLSDFCLFYYKGPEEDKTLGSILLPSYKISPCTSEDRVFRKYAFKAEHHNMRTYYFASETKDTMHMWMNAMSLASILQRNSSGSILHEREPASVNSLTPNEDEDSGFTSYHSRRHVGSPQHDGNSTLASSYTSESYRYRADDSTSDMSHHMSDGGYLGSSDKYPNGYGTVSDYRHPPQVSSKHHAPPKPKRTPADHWDEEADTQVPLSAPIPAPRTRYTDLDSGIRKPPQRRTPDPYARTAVLNQAGNNRDECPRTWKASQRPHSTELGDYDHKREYMVREPRTQFEAERYDPPKYVEAPSRNLREAHMQFQNSTYPHPHQSMTKLDPPSYPSGHEFDGNTHKIGHKSKKPAPATSATNTSFDSYLAESQAPQTVIMDSASVGTHVKDAKRNHHHDHHVLQQLSHQHHATHREEDQRQFATLADGPRGSNASFLRSASARLASAQGGTLGPHYRSSRERDRDRDPSGRWSKVPQQMHMLTPSQREASMKRLLEWKRRMLQSPLTKKQSQRCARIPPIGAAEDEYRNQLLLELAHQETMALAQKEGDGNAKGAWDKNALKENKDPVNTRNDEEDNTNMLYPRSASRTSSKSPLRTLAPDPRRVPGSVNRYNSYSSDDEEATNVPERKRNRKSRRNSAEKDGGKAKRDVDYVNLNTVDQEDPEKQTVDLRTRKQHLYINIPSIGNQPAGIVEGKRRRHHSEPEMVLLGEDEELDEPEETVDDKPQKPKEYQDCWTQTGLSPTVPVTQVRSDNHWKVPSNYEKVERNYEDDDGHEARNVEELRNKDRDLHRAYVKNYRKEQERRLSAYVAHQIPPTPSIGMPFEETTVTPVRSEETAEPKTEKNAAEQPEVRSLEEMLKRKESPPKNIVQERIRIFETNSTSSEEKVTRRKGPGSASSDSGDVKSEDVASQEGKSQSGTSSGKTVEKEPGKGDEPQYMNLKTSPRGGRQDEEYYLPMHGTGNGVLTGSNINAKSWLHSCLNADPEAVTSAFRRLTPEEAVYVQMDNQGFLSHYSRGEALPSISVSAGGYFLGAYCEIGERLRAEEGHENMAQPAPPSPPPPPPPPPTPHEPMYAELKHPLVATGAVTKEAPPPLLPQPRLAVPTPRPRNRMTAVRFNEMQGSQSDTSGASDADDEASKELNVPSRFSLSDSFRPASYYLKASLLKDSPPEIAKAIMVDEGCPSSLQYDGDVDEGRGEDGSSNSETPPPVPLTPPPPLDDIPSMTPRPLPPAPASETWGPLPAVPPPDLMVNVSYSRVYEDDRRLTEFLTRPVPTSPSATATTSSVLMLRDTNIQWADMTDDTLDMLQNRSRWSPGTAPYYYSDILSSTGPVGMDPPSGLSSPSSSTRGTEPQPQPGPTFGTRLRVPLNNSRTNIMLGPGADSPVTVGRKVNNIELATSREALGSESLPAAMATAPEQIIRVATELNSSIEYWETKKLAGTKRNTYESDTLQRQRAHAGTLGALSALELRNIYSGGGPEKLASTGTQDLEDVPPDPDFGSTMVQNHQRRSRSLEGLLDIREQERPEAEDPEPGNGEGGYVGGRGDVATSSARRDDNPLAPVSSQQESRELERSSARDPEHGSPEVSEARGTLSESVSGSMRDAKRSARGWISQVPTEDSRTLAILREAANGQHFTSLATDDAKAGLSFSAGDLLGKTHEELVLLLIQLRRDQMNIEMALKKCRMELDTAQRLLHVDLCNREKHIARHKELLDHHEELMRQHELTKPLVNLVDNMVKLGALYGAGGNGTGSVPGYEDVDFSDEFVEGQLMQAQRLRNAATAQSTIEFSRQLQEQRLLQSEKANWEQLNPAQGNLQDKLENLCKLDQVMQEESTQMFGLQQDKDYLERAIEGLRDKVGGCKDDPSQLDRLQRQLWMAEKELAKVTAQLSLSSKKLEETAAENVRLENEIMGLRQKVQASLKHHQALGASPLPAETTRMKAQLETELKRITTVMEDLANQRAELCKAMEHVKDRNHELLSHVRPSPTGVAGSAPLPGKKLPRSTYMETDLDTMETHDIVDMKSMADHGLRNVSTTQIPLYVNSRLLDDHSKDQKSGVEDVDSSFEYLQSDGNEYELQDINDADDKMKRFYGILPKEKPAEIKTVRIVKRESERRNKGKDRRKVCYDENSLRRDESDEAETETYEETEIVDSSELDEFQRSMSLPRDYGRFYPGGLPQGYTARPTPPNSLYMNTVNRNTPKYYRTPSLSGSDSALSAHERLFGPASPTTLSIPTFTSEAAKRIVEETARELAVFDKEREIVKEEAGSLKRRHKRRHYTISSSQPVALETDATNAHKLIHARSRDDLDMERCLRVANTPDVVKSTIKKNDMYDESTIDRELGLPQKILIPERYVEEEEEQLTVAERLQRLQKAESIRKMLSEGTAYGDVSTDEVASVTLKKKFEAEKKQREHLLALNQMIAQEVMQKSKAVAASVSSERGGN